MLKDTTDHGSDMSAEASCAPAAVEQAVSAARHHIYLCADADSSQLSVQGIVEALELANYFAGRQHYQTLHCDLASVRRCFRAQCGQPGRSTLIFVGNSIARWPSTRQDARSVKDLLNKVSRTAVAGSAVFVLQDLGLLDGTETSVHPNFRAALSEGTTDARFLNTAYWSDGKIHSAVGGIAAIQMIIEMVRSDLGGCVADAVETSLGAAEKNSEIQSREVWNWGHSALADPVVHSSLKEMKSNIECPVGIHLIARRHGISIRALQRRFMKLFDRTPSQIYQDLRLHHARTLVRQTDMKLIEIGLACGFSSASNFSITFKKKFGQPPSAERESGHLCRQQ